MATERHIGLIQVEIFNNILNDAIFKAVHLRQRLQESLILLFNDNSQLFVLFTNCLFFLEFLWYSKLLSFIKCVSCSIRDVNFEVFNELGSYKVEVGLEYFILILNNFLRIIHFLIRFHRLSLRVTLFFHVFDMNTIVFLFYILLTVILRIRIAAFTNPRLEKMLAVIPSY